MDFIPFLDLSRQYQKIKQELLKASEEVFEASAFSLGSRVERFEKQFASFCQVKHAVGVDNGTSAIVLALKASGISENDEVLVPANSFIATAAAVSNIGGVPVFVDCTPDTWQISPDDAMRKITSKTKAIIGVHLYGAPFDVNSILKIAEENNLIVIEDCAQAQGATYNGVSVGNFGKAGTFSFYPVKNLGAYGEAGALVTNDEEVSERVRRLRNHGSIEKYVHEEIGFNMRMDALQAAFLSVKLNHLDEWNLRRREIAAFYKSAIWNPKLNFQYVPENCHSVYHLYVVTTKDRDGFREYLNQHKIGSGLHYPIPCHLQKAFSSLGYLKGDLPNSEYLAEHCLSLPMFPELRQSEIEYIAEVINNY
ncbi:pleiotropic regulatory protein [Sporocytophaga myxococcoides]|uniref:Pleiotropic regulatory protein n=1 Tax=Sporocytophaga myxococcoides TaxID=153721 RepID=A0A098LCL9_9BACT|nr:DegT/DnrJ/EryC1/StrS family aminotransferase [Sporocytophaga myxococcoides]GAL83773.1 pleiotropic regulatory protein [Sporocytophaga myxococcoides]